MLRIDESTPVQVRANADGVVLVIGGMAMDVEPDKARFIGESLQRASDDSNFAAALKYRKQKAAIKELVTG